MKFTDAVAIADTRRRESDGALLADARVARTGIQTYAGYEVGKPEMAVVRVYRPDSEVFSRDAMASFAHRPVTNDHPDEAVTADNWKEHSVGNTVDEIARDGQFLRVPLMVSDATAIADIQAGKRELSAGYSATLVWGDGKTPDGEAYDAMQTHIRANHVAIVARGRAGSQVRIGDGADDSGKDRKAWGVAPISTTDKETITMSDALRTVVVDGLSVSTTDQGAQAITKLMKDLEASAAKFTDLEKKAKDDEEEAEKKLAKKDAEIDDLKGKILDAAALDKLVADRAALIDTARKIAKDVKTDGLSDAEIRKAVVKAKLGDAAIADKADAYVDARFDILAEDAEKNVDPVKVALQNRDTTHNTNDNGQAKYEQRLADAWKHQKEA